MIHAPIESSGWHHAPSDAPLAVARWHDRLKHLTPQIPPGPRGMLVALLADRRFGSDQLFLTADALREAHAQATADEKLGLAHSLAQAAQLLETAAADRAIATDWSRAA